MTPAGSRDRLEAKVEQLLRAKKTLPTPRRPSMNNHLDDKLKNIIAHLAIGTYNYTGGAEDAREAIVTAVFDPIYALAPKDQFLHWKQSDIAHFFERLGKLERMLRGEEDENE